MQLFTIIIAILLSIFLYISSAQDCLNACNLPLTTCTFIDYPIYPYINITANEIDASEIISQAQGLAHILGQECVDEVEKYTCGYLYPSCMNSTDEGGPPQKIKPCIQMCTDVNSACSAYLSLLPSQYQQFLNCSQLDPSSGLPFFSPDSPSSGDCYVLDSLTNSCNGSNNTGISGCQQYDPSLSPLSSSYCAPFISNEVFVPFLSPPNAQSSLDILANSTLWEISKLYPVLTLGCYKSLMSLLCQTAYPSCNRVIDSSGDTIELGAYPCNQYCQTVAQDCSFFSDLLGYQLINCSLTDGNGKLLWPFGPSYEEYVSYKNVTVENTCANSLFPPNASTDLVLPPVEKCPSVLAKTPHPTDAESICWIPCPDPTYTEKMWQQLTQIGLVGASVSFTLMAFLVLSTVLSAKKRNRRIHVCVYVSVMLQNISFFINTAHPEYRVWCNDPVTYATNGNNAACATQAFIFQWFTLALAVWWLIVAFHMYLTIVKRMKYDETQEYEKFYHILGWGIPLILTTITAGVGSHGYGPPAAWCYIHDKGYANNYVLGFPDPAGIDTDYYVFYIPIGICLIIAAILMVLVFRYIYQTFREVGEIRNTTKNNLQVQARVLFFVVALFVIFILFCEWRFSLQASDPNKIKHDDFLYVFCQIKNDLGIEYSNVCSSDELPYRVNFAHTAFETFLASTIGIFVFMSFGTDPAIFTWWGHLRRIKSKDELFAYIATETTKSSVGSGTEDDLKSKESEQ